MTVLVRISAIFTLMASMHSVSSLAAPLSFDCDVPADHYSSVSQDIEGPPTISGTVEVVQMRSGNNLPVAGGRLVSRDNADSLGFQLIATSTHAKYFDIVLNMKHHEDAAAKRGGASRRDVDNTFQPFSIRCRKNDAIDRQPQL